MPRNQEHTADGITPAQAFYGGGPGKGITLPPYYRPTPSVQNGTTYFPLAERLGEDEMRISFAGSCPFPPRLEQAGPCILVELGNGRSFIFDYGPGCLRNLLALQIPMPAMNDIFLTNLHTETIGELPYLYAFAPWTGRWKPLRVHGPSGRTPREGTAAMIARAIPFERFVPADVDRRHRRDFPRQATPRTTAAARAAAKMPASDGRRSGKAAARRSGAKSR